jgi:cytochrome c oxidase subunit 3
MELVGQRKIETSKIAMTIMMISWAIFFVTLFVVYALFRATSNVWPPAGFDPIPLNLPLISTFIVCASSMTYELFRSKFLTRHFAQAKLFLLTTFLLGLGFLGTQASLWRLMKSLGYYVESGVFTSLVYSFTWIHSAHIGLAIIALFWVFYKFNGYLKDNKTDNESHALLFKNVGTFWHFLGIVWLIIFITIFVF